MSQEAYGQLTQILNSIIIRVHSGLLVHFGCTNFRIEYFVVMNKTMIKFVFKMMMGNSSDREDRNPLHLPHGHVLLQILSSTGVPHIHFNVIIVYRLQWNIQF